MRTHRARLCFFDLPFRLRAAPKPNSIKLLGLFFAVHFVLFLTQSHASAPETKNGEYVLNEPRARA
jgi:hypothetical protein